MMKKALIAALSSILAMFLTGPQVHSGQCQSLTEEGVYVDGRDEDRNSDLIQAASTPKPVEDIRILLKAGAAAYATNVAGETSLSNVSRAVPDNRHVRIVWALLVPEPGAWGRQGVTALTKAGEHGNPARIQALAASGADVSACDGNGETAPMTDAATGYQEAVGVTPVTGAEHSVPTPYG